jgi:predicted PhzF superfamily epimerase YddE/YHI9
MRAAEDFFQLWLVDAFTSQIFAGNPAGVCILPKPPAADWMQSVAAEVNASETAFVWPAGRDVDHGRATTRPSTPHNDWHLRWFTPTTEVDLCGHATLAAAHVLWQSQHAADSDLLLHTSRSGSLTARTDGTGIEIALPADTIVAVEVDPWFERAVGRRVVQAYRGRDDLLLALEDTASVREAMPDLELIRSQPGLRGIIITAKADQGSEVDVVSRFFAPSVGVPEDPVTGSAHCTLAAYWVPLLGRASFSAQQLSARGGHLQVVARGEEIRLSGRATTVMSGRLGEQAILTSRNASR